MGHPMKHFGLSADTAWERRDCREVTVCSESDCGTVLSRYRPANETLCYACREKHPLPNPHSRRISQSARDSPLPTRHLPPPERSRDDPTLRGSEALSVRGHVPSRAVAPHAPAPPAPGPLAPAQAADRTARP